MERDYLANTVLALAVFLAFWALYSLGEGRVDAYISVYTLEYFVVKALFRPRRVTRDYLAAVLFAVFVAIVVYRVLEVLGLHAV
ncbi:hypothetical protein IG193_02150 [Infirmifilum lucidum]|uniref:Uncharacterized protein n=1 Tax=Infirmifilum lucidum TaxID=2776706 RepID=A0A7L9FHT8_9CREN|nr:hypothetical protein [Infirmifilum lucidum]QOJ79287.1 hypothetical protein IG193_02150 [Infirmifilum lucidum]